MAQLLRNIINALISFPPEQQWKLLLITQWPTIMGSLHDKARLEKITDDTITLGVYDAAWTQELYLLSSLIINTINQNLDQPRIKHLRFKRVVPLLDIYPATIRIPEARPLVEIPLTSEQHKILQSVKDPELRRALQAFLTRCSQEIR